jgi:dienelactone hydrolase
MADTTIPGERGDLPVYLATPATSQPWPGVVVIHDAFGMGHDVRSQADWLAGEGYLTAAPDLFAWGRPLTCVRRATTPRSWSSSPGRSWATATTQRRPRTPGSGSRTSSPPTCGPAASAGRAGPGSSAGR